MKLNKKPHFKQVTFKYIPIYQCSATEFKKIKLFNAISCQKIKS